jgi:hypothetical protein
MMRMLAPATTASKVAVNFAVAVADQKPERGGAAAEVHQQERACWVTQAPVGSAVMPARCTRRRPCSITTRM